MILVQESSAVLEETLVLSGHVLSADRGSCLGEIKVQGAVPEQQVGSSWAVTGTLRRAVLQLTSQLAFSLNDLLWRKEGGSHLRNVVFGVTLQNRGCCVWQGCLQLSACGWNAGCPWEQEAGEASGRCRRLEQSWLTRGAGGAAAPALLVFAVLGTAPQTPQAAQSLSPAAGISPELRVVTKVCSSPPVFPALLRLVWLGQ